MTYKIGQILTLSQDMVAEKALSGDKNIIPKGTQVMIGPDGLAHYMHNGCIQPLPEDAEVKGYDVKGLAEYLVKGLKEYLPWEDITEEYPIDEEELTEELKYRLYDIGF